MYQQIKVWNQICKINQKLLIERDKFYENEKLCTHPNSWFALYLIFDVYSIALCTVLVNHLGPSLPGKSVVRLTDQLNMTIVVDWDFKLQIKQTNKIGNKIFSDFQQTSCYTLINNVILKSSWCDLIFMIAESDIIPKVM